jgi:cytidyltransferase-like protein
MPPSLSVRQHEPMVSSQRRRGVFPGSFNPLTIAHLEIARRAREEHRLDEVHLVVSTVALDKPTPPGPSFDERVMLLEADAAELDWLFVGTTARQLIVDIAEGYDIVIMGADKWHQVNDASYYESAHERDAALARLPQVAVAPRDGLAAPDALTMQTPTELHGVSSTLARRGRRELMAPHAAANWRDDQPLTIEPTGDEDEEPRP